MMEKMKKTLFFIFMMGCFLCAFRTGEAQAESVGTPLYTAEDLLKMSGSSSSFYLANDIDMTEYGLWTPIDFSGTLDGNGYAISNLKVTGQNGGLFGVLKDASVKNLKLLVGL